MPSCQCWDKFSLGIWHFQDISLLKVETLWCSILRNAQWMVTVKFQFSIATSLFQRTCNKKNLHSLFLRTNSTPIHQKVHIVLRVQVQQYLFELNQINAPKSLGFFHVVHQFFILIILNMIIRRSCWYFGLIFCKYL